ncbi:MAG: hypothetical protein U5L96_08855 [Owenweeksia sp.]|nr:hypothetical protein [Owenweeksia sp.]
MNPWWAVTLDDKGHPDWIFWVLEKRSKIYRIYLLLLALYGLQESESWRRKTFYGEGHIFWEMDWKRASDIDNYEDLDLAMVLIKGNERI